MRVPAPRWRALLAPVACAALAAALVSCSDDDGGAAPDTTPAPTAQVCASAPPPLQVDHIADAIAAVVAERGGPPRFYEINATSLLVNLFVAGDAPGEVVPYLFVDGDLRPGERVQGASGNTFPASAVDFEPTKVLSCVAAQLDPATFDAFEVLGGAGDTVQYSLITRSAGGGQLIVVLGPDGAVRSVEPVGGGGAADSTPVDTTPVDTTPVSTS